jgi:hypothetical protein
MNIVFYDELFNPVEMEQKSQKNSIHGKICSDEKKGARQNALINKITVFRRRRTRLKRALLHQPVYAGFQK